MPNHLPGSPSPTALLRILFVEDNDYLRDTIGALLEEDDREIVACASAEAALAQLDAGAFDLLLTDISLGEGRLSGVDLARRVLAVSPGAWVVVSSGYVIDPATLSGLGPNVRSMPKPFELDDMDRLLAEVRASRR